MVEVPRSRTLVPIDPFDVVATLGERGRVAAVLGQYEDRPSQRDMAAHISDAYNEGGHRPARGGNRGREVVRLPGPGAGLGPGQRRADGHQHQHHQPAGTAGGEGPAPAPAGPGHRRSRPHLRLAQGVAELPLPFAAAAGPGRIPAAAGAGTQGRAGHPGRVGRPYHRWHPERPAVPAQPRGVGRSQRRGRPLHPGKVPPFRALLPLQRPAPCRRGRRRGGQSPPAGGRPLGPAGAGQLDGRGGASTLSAAHPRRGPPPRGRRRPPPRHPGHLPGHPPPARPVRAQRQGTAADALLRTPP